MNDPFAMLDPMTKAKSPAISGGSASTAANYATTPMNYGQAPGFSMQQAANPFGGLPPQQHQQQQQYGGGVPMGMMNNNNMQMYPQLNNNNGAAFMTQPGPASFSGLPQGQHQQQQQHAMVSNPFMQQQQAAPFLTQPMNNNSNSNPFGGSSNNNNMYPSQQQQQQQLDPFGTQMKPSGGGLMPPQLRPAEHTMPPAPLRHSSSIIVDFDPFSPRENTPRSPYDYQTVDQSGSDSAASSSTDSSDRRRQTQEAQRSQLGFSSDSFNASNAPKISLKDLANQPGVGSNNVTARGPSSSFDDSPFFTDNDDAFADHNMFANLDDEPGTNKKDWGQFAKDKRTAEGDSGTTGGGADEDEIPDECGPNEYDVTFETGRKLGVLMERVDVCGKSRDDKRQEIAVVKLVVENGAADRVGVTTGSSVVAINARSVARDSYAVVLDMIKAAPRPMSIRFKRGTVNKDTTQGNVLTRISSKWMLCVCCWLYVEIGSDLLLARLPWCRWHLQCGQPHKRQCELDGQVLCLWRRQDGRAPALCLARSLSRGTIGRFDNFMHFVPYFVTNFDNVGMGENQFPTCFLL